MLHKVWNSKGEMPYCFPRSSIKFQGHTVQNITDFDPNWAFPDYRPVAAFKSLRFALLCSYKLTCCIPFLILEDLIRRISKCKWIHQMNVISWIFIECNEWFLAATKQLYEWFSPSVRLSVCLSVCLSVRHTFLTMLPSSYHHEIFRSYHQGTG